MPGENLILQAGEQILCTRCRAPLAVADREVFMPAAVSLLRLLPKARLGEGRRLPGVRSTPGDRQLLCRCGGGARDGMPGCLLVRSGDWVGWRPLEGE
jgi:hypothetical protein